jgi:hypothetical protein
VEKYCKARQTTDDNVAHAGYLRLQEHRVCNFIAFPQQKWLLERYDTLPVLLLRTVMAVQ